MHANMGRGDDFENMSSPPVEGGLATGVVLFRALERADFFAFSHPLVVVLDRLLPFSYLYVDSWSDSVQQKLAIELAERSGKLLTMVLFEGSSSVRNLLPILHATRKAAGTLCLRGDHPVVTPFRRGNFVEQTDLRGCIAFLENFVSQQGSLPGSGVPAKASG